MATFLEKITASKMATFQSFWDICKSFCLFSGCPVLCKPTWNYGAPVAVLSFNTFYKRKSDLKQTLI